MIIGVLDHFAPEQFLIRGQDVEKIPVGGDGGSLRGGHGLEKHWSGKCADRGRVSLGNLKTATAGPVSSSSATSAATVSAGERGRGLVIVSHGREV